MVPPLTRGRRAGKRLVPLVGVFSCLCFLGAGQPQTTPIQQAAEKIRQADYGTAVSLLVPLATTPPAEKAPEAQLMLGYSYFQLGVYGAADQVLAAAGEGQGPLQGYALYYGGMSRLAQDDSAGACQYLSRVAGAHPPGSLRARGWYATARCRVELKDFPLAFLALDALDQDSGRPAEWTADLLMLRAAALDQGGAPEQVWPLLRRLWVEFPTSPPAGQAEALILGPGSERFVAAGVAPVITEQDRLERVDRLLGQAAFRQALLEIEPLIEAGEEAEVSPEQEAALRWRRAKAFAGLRRYSAAAAEYERIFKLSGESDVEAAYQAGRTWDRMDRQHQALAAYQEVWTRFPQSDQARWSLFSAGRAHQLDLEHEEANRLFELLVRTYPGPEPADEALFQLGWMRYLDRRYPEALAFFQQVPLRPQDAAFNARALYWQARAWDRMGRAEPAQALRQELVEQYPDSAYSYLARHFAGLALLPWPLPEQGSQPGALTQGPLDFGVVEQLISLGLVLDAREDVAWQERRGATFSPTAALQISRAFLAAGEYFLAQRRVQLSFGPRLASYQAPDRELWELAYPWAFPEAVSQQSARAALDPRLVLALIRAESTYRPTIRSSAGALGLMQIMPATGRRIARSLQERNFETERLQEPELNLRFGCYYLRQLLDRYRGGSTAFDQLTLDGELGSKPRPRVYRGELAEVRTGRSASPSAADLILALAAYNAGERRVEEWRRRFEKFHLGPDEFIEQIPFPETRTYVKRVLAFYQTYSLLYPQI